MVYRKLNNKGFTLLELTASMFFMSFIFLSIYFIPTDLLISSKTINTESNFSLDYSLLNQSIKSDISMDYGWKLIDDNAIEIGETTYEFTEDGLFRIKDGKKIKLINESLNFEVNNNILSIRMRNRNKNKDIKIDYDLEYSSIPSQRR